MTNLGFRHALAKVYESGEFDKLIKNAPTTREKEAIFSIKASLDNWVNDGKSIQEIPFIPLVASIKSYTLFQEISLIMNREE